MTASEIIAILSGISGLFVGIIAALSGARKDQFSALQATVEGVIHENERLRERMKELEACIDDSEKTIKDLTKQVDDWKQKYNLLNLDWSAKYAKLQEEFDNLRKTVSN